VIDVVVWWSAPLAAEERFLGLLDEIEQGRYDAYRQELDNAGS
jgi:4'-phosphopantetheinyl transferase